MSALKYAIILALLVLTGCATTASQKQYLEEDLASIQHKFTSKQSPLTDLQKEELWKTYKGKLVKGVAYVHSIDKNLFGQYVILADFQPRGQYDIGSDLAIFFKDSEKDKLLRIAKNERIAFEGKLSGYHSLLGNLDIENAVLTTDMQVQEKSNEKIQNVASTLNTGVEQDKIIEVKKSSVPLDAITICNSIGEAFYGVYDQHIKAKANCLAQISIKYEDIDVCNQISQEYSDTAKQYLGICRAAILNDATECDDKKTGVVQDYCLNVAMEYSGRVDFCDAILDEGAYADWCNALRNNDVSKCPDYSAECYRSIAKKTKDPDICLKIQKVGYADRELCIMEIALLRSDKNIISTYLHKLSVPEKQKEEFFKEDILQWEGALNDWFDIVKEKNVKKCDTMSKRTPLTSNGQVEIATQCYRDIAIY